MGVKRLNHAVLYVRNARRSAEWYARIFGMEVVSELGDGQGVFMRIPDGGNDHDIAFFSLGDGAGPSDAGSRTVGLYHLAWQVENLTDLVDFQVRLSEEGALVGATDHTVTKSLYAKDPDGLEFEVMWLVPREDLTETELTEGGGLKPLDLGRELARFGG